MCRGHDRLKIKNKKLNVKSLKLKSYELEVKTEEKPLEKIA
jgi:hypothetical protein